MTVRPQQGQRWTPVQDARLTALLAENRTLADIAATLGRSKAAITSRREHLARVAREAG